MSDIEARVKKIIAEQLGVPESDVTNYWLGSVLSGGGSSPGDARALAWADLYDRLQGYALRTRLQIPILYGVDAVHGHNNVRDAVIFPHNIGLGCTRDAALVERVAGLRRKSAVGEPDAGSLARFGLELPCALSLLLLLASALLRLVLRERPLLRLFCGLAASIGQLPGARLARGVVDRRDGFGSRFGHGQRCSRSWSCRRHDLIRERPGRRPRDDRRLLDLAGGHGQRRRLVAGRAPHRRTHQDQRSDRCGDPHSLAPPPMP